MNESDVLEVIYNYRLAPDPLAVPMIFSYTAQQKLLRLKDTAIAWSGVVTAFCERHPDHYAMWKGMHWPTIEQAMKIANHAASHINIRWADHLTLRYIILATDETAWALIMRAHNTDKKIAQGAQSCIERLCIGTVINDSSGLPKLNSQSMVQGSIEFPDLRTRLLELNEEFRRMTIQQRQSSFSRLPFSPEFRAKRLEERQGLVLLGAGLIQ